MTDIVESYADDDRRKLPGYRGGSRRSVKRLEYFGFDPIEALVNKYQELEKEADYQRKLRSGEIVEIGADGKVKNFWTPNLHGVYDKQILIAEKLLKYRYGTVSEEGDDGSRPMAGLTVVLHNEGEIYAIGESSYSAIDDDDTKKSSDPDIID